MSRVINVNGENYDFPTVNDNSWGEVVTDWAEAISAKVAALNALEGTGELGATGLQGLTGVQGIAGSQGIQGPTGPGGAGIQGVTGVRGLDGIDGIQGATGVRGQQGTTGALGLTGAEGQTGIRGLQGFTGVQGLTGAQGQTGVRGTTGVQGIQGQTGIQGLTGVRGQTGAQGYTGIQGTTGVQGIQGDTGVRGVTGLRGPTGARGPTGFVGTTGIEGQLGLQGAQGVTGLDVGPNYVGETGVKGATGIQGVTGIQGIDGSTGIQGPAGSGSYGEIYLTGATGTSITSGTPVRVNGAFSSTDLNNFDNPENGRLRYTGSATGEYIITAIFSAESDTVNKIYSLYLYKNGSEIVGAFQREEFGVAGEVNNVVVSCIVELATNDYVELYADVDSGTVNLTLDNLVLTAFGAQGPQGDTGVQGIQGQTGAQGYTGVRGQTGIQGVTGLIGETGAQGYTGAEGKTGIQGETGPLGNTGLEGIGTQGPIGSTGIQGQTGVRGQTGIQGAQGETGLAPDNQGTTGVQGETGLRGVTGVQGIQGETGIKGATGAQGTTGVKGETGPSGSAVFTRDSGNGILYPTNAGDGITGIGSLYMDDGNLDLRSATDASTRIGRIRLDSSNVGFGVGLGTGAPSNNIVALAGRSNAAEEPVVKVQNNNTGTLSNSLFEIEQVGTNGANLLMTAYDGSYTFGGAHLASKARIATGTTGIGSDLIISSPSDAKVTIGNHYLNEEDHNASIVVSGDKVGIGGVTGPERQLHVDNNTSNPNVVLVESGFSDGSYIRFRDTTTTSSATEPHLGAYGNNFRILTNNTARLNILSTGEVSIGGISSPVSALEILGNTSDGCLTFTSSTSDLTNKQGRIVGYPYNNSHDRFLAYELRGLSTENQIYYGGGSSILVPATRHTFWAGTGTTGLSAGTQTMDIVEGKVGIGTSSPTYQFEVDQGATQGIVAQFKGDSWTYVDISAGANDPILYLRAGSDNWALQHDDSDTNAFNLRYNNVTKFKIDTNANITLPGNLTFQGSVEGIQWDSQSATTGFDNWDMISVSDGRLQIRSANDNRSATFAPLSFYKQGGGTNPHYVDDIRFISEGFVQMGSLADLDAFYFDMVNERFGINVGSSPSYTIDVVGDINSSTGYRVGGSQGLSGTLEEGNFIATFEGGILTGATGVGWTAT